MYEIPNLLVVNPYSQGFHTHIKITSEDLGPPRIVRSPGDVSEPACSIPKPCLVVYIGRGYEHSFGRIVFLDIDLCTIPISWIAHIPLVRVCERARFAARIVEAHLLDPIKIVGAKDLQHLYI